MFILNAGRLRDKVTFLQYVDSLDEYGRSVPKLQEYKTVWAEVKPMRGYEYLEYYREKNKVLTKVTCRYFEGCDESMVVRVNGKLHEVTAVIDVENRHTALEVMIQERVGDEKKVSDNG